MLPTENELDFNQRLINTIVKTVEQENSAGKKIWAFVKNLRPIISYDNFTGLPQVTLSSDQQATKTNLEAAFELLDSLQKKVVVIIDEFQQILEYPEKNFDNILRTIMQGLQNVVFIFSGSQQHLMNEMFANNKRPFYRSTQFLPLGKIDFDLYKNFIINKFKEAKKSIPEEIVRDILQWTERHTYFTQVVCSRIFALQTKKITDEIYKNELVLILKEQENVFFRYRSLLSPQQWLMLKAMAEEDIVYSVTNKNFIHKYNVSSSATAIKSLKALLEKEMIYEDFDDQGKKYYSVYDLFFKRWIQHRMLMGV